MANVHVREHRVSPPSPVLVSYVLPTVALTLSLPSPAPTLHTSSHHSWALALEVPKLASLLAYLGPMDAPPLGPLSW